MSFIAVYVTTDVCKLDDIMRYLAIIELAVRCLSVLMARELMSAARIASFPGLCNVPKIEALDTSTLTYIAGHSR